MRPLVEISASDIDSAACTLVCEVESEGFSFVIYSEQLETRGFCTYHFGKSPHTEVYETQLRKVLSETALLSGVFRKTYIIYSRPESALVPFAIYRSEKNNDTLSLLHGDAQRNDIILTDVLIEDQVYNIYRINPSVIELLMEKFPAALTFHQHSVLLRQPVPEISYLDVIIYQAKIVVRAIKESRAMLVSSYAYTEADDVVYTLLNICSQHAMAACPVILSGLIEKDSSIFKEVHKYFANVGFSGDESRSRAEELKEISPHYFHHLFGAESCE